MSQHPLPLPQLQKAGGLYLLPAVIDQPDGNGGDPLRKARCIFPEGPGEAPGQRTPESAPAGQRGRALAPDGNSACPPEPSPGRENPAAPEGKYRKAPLSAKRPRFPPGSPEEPARRWPPPIASNGEKAFFLRPFPDVKQVIRPGDALEPVYFIEIGQNLILPHLEGEHRPPVFLPQLPELLIEIRLCIGVFPVDIALHLRRSTRIIFS